MADLRRLPAGPDSSSSTRIAFRSSETDTTGNNKARREIVRTDRNRYGRSRDPRTETGARQHSISAGTASISHTRLRSNSISR